MISRVAKHGRLGRLRISVALEAHPSSAYQLDLDRRPFDDLRA
jgi:hypothetical protein